jgi:mannose/cellobiose epimerase-like protein (N-acyl-D-glucosamine 2-epimerase family)
MKRRDFLGTALAAGILGASPGLRRQNAQAARQPTKFQPTVLDAMPRRIAGMTLEELLADYHDRLFNRYLPFWDKGGDDKKFGGFICELNDDGSIFNDDKYIWYQGRAIWVYSFLFNNFGKEPRFLEVAERTRDFMVKHMYAGRGRWYEHVHRDGGLKKGIGENVYGWLFAATGLAEYYKATGREKDLELAKESIWAAVRTYDDPAYTGAFAEGETNVDVPKKGLRSQGHSMLIVRILSQLLAHHDDSRLEKLQREHVDYITTRFWNPEYGIVNEYLLHDYSRVPGAEAHMFAGHSLETLWMVMQEALRIKDRALFDTYKNRIRRLLEMCWDYVFEGWGSEDFFVFDSPKHRQGPRFDVKTMWAHCEILVACMMVLEHTGEVWAKEWYERVRAFTLRTMPVEGCGVWRQAVDRQGKDLKRIGSSKRKGNFHQPRLMMLNMLSLKRMIENRGERIPFPKLQ